MKNSSLSNITLPVKNELQTFNDLFYKSLRSNVKLVDLIAKYILKQKGKKIRPLIVLLAAQVSGGITERTYRGAMLVELLHTATLVHDDVVDNAEKRRGLPSINAIWKNKVGVLMGDYLLAKGLMIAVEGEDYDFLKTITNTVSRMSQGELLQINKTRKLDIDEETYFRIISDKTSSLIETCAKIGAASACSDETNIEALRGFGEHLGFAFQIRDDILDFIGSTHVFGKSLGADIKEKKITLPLIHTINQANESEKKIILKLIKGSRKNDNFEEVMRYIKKYEGIEYAEKAALDYAENAKSKLKLFDESEAKTALLDLIDFVTARKK